MSGPASERFWVAVACASHVSVGVTGGFAQVCHGKPGPLARMKAGDWVAYYSPSSEMGGGTKLRCFTALGRVAGEPYQVSMPGGFQPFRRTVDFVSAVRPAPIVPLLNDLAFIKDKQYWGAPFRFGLVEVSRADMAVIAQAMGATL